MGIKMRIISKFHDYYDSVQGYGFDPTVVYMRQRKALKDHSLGDSMTRMSGMCDMVPHGANISRIGQLYFCGKKYPFMRISFKEDSKRESCYSFDAYEKLVLSLAKKNGKFLKDYERKRFFMDGGSVKKAVKRYFSAENDFEKNVKTHEKFDAPVFAVYAPSSRANVIVNPVLRKMGFQKMFDPYTTYQEIDMFLSGVMQSKEKSIIQISDKYQKLKKGFDDYSFKPKMKRRQ